MDIWRKASGIEGERILKDHQMHDWTCSWRPLIQLIEGQKGGQYSEQSIQQIMHQAVFKSGIDCNATVHTLRHSFATHHVLNGVNLKAVQEYLGHASSKTNEIHTHIPDELKSKIKSPIDD